VYSQTARRAYEFYAKVDIAGSKVSRMRRAPGRFDVHHSDQFVLVITFFAYSQTNVQKNAVAMNTQCDPDHGNSLLSDQVSGITFFAQGWD
jgi:hypothetical protein